MQDVATMGRLATVLLLSRATHTLVLATAPPPGAGFDENGSAECVRRWLADAISYCPGMWRSGPTFATRSRRSTRTSAGGVTAGSGSRAPPLRQMQGMGPAAGEDMEGHREGLQAEAPAGPSIRLLWKDKATEVASDFLSTRVWFL